MSASAISMASHDTRYKGVVQHALRIGDHHAVLDDEQHDGDDLRDGLRLAVPAGGDDHALAGGHHADARHDELAREDDERYPRGQHAQLDEREQGGGHEDLVGQGVDELAEVRHLAAAARQVPVEAVGGGQQDEDAGGDPGLRRLGVRPEREVLRPRADDGHHEHGNEADAQQRHHVRRGPQLLVHGTLRHRAHSPSIS